MVQAHAVLNRRSQARLEWLGPKVVLHALGQGRLAGEDLPEPRTDVALRDLTSVIELPTLVHVRTPVHVAEVENGKVSEVTNRDLVHVPTLVHVVGALSSGLSADGMESVASLLPVRSRS